MTAGLSSASGPVIELGPGTGVITRSLLNRGVKPDDLVAIELSTTFAATLQKRHPNIRVIEGDASRIEALSPFAPGKVDCVVCGLPLVSLPNDTIERILRGSFNVLNPQGAFRLFTYATHCPVRPGLLEKVGLSSRKVSRTLRNLPPALVYELRRLP